MSIATPAQFPAVRIKGLTPDEIVGKYYRDAQGSRGMVRYRFDLATYHVVEFHSDEPHERRRLRPLNWLRTMRFFETREQLDGDVDSFFLGAQMEAST